VLSSNPFAALAGSETPAPEEVSEPEATAPKDQASKDNSSIDPMGDKLVVRKEKKGHGGKTVTIIDGLDLGGDELEELARELRQAMGCGGRTRDSQVLVSGERQEQVAAWLRERGAARVIIGN
jgi:translation initiation factor 1